MIVEQLDRTYKLFNKLKFFGMVVSGVSIFIMMLVISADVFSRNFLTGSITGSIEFVQYYFMPLSIFPGVAYVYATGILPKMELLLEKFSEGIKNVLINILLVVEFIIFTVVIYYTFKYAMSGVELSTSFTAGGNIYPIYPLLFLVPIIFIMLNIEIVFIFIRNMIATKDRAS